MPEWEVEFEELLETLESLGSYVFFGLEDITIDNGVVSWPRTIMVRRVGSWTLPGHYWELLPASVAMPEDGMLVATFSPSKTNDFKSPIELLVVDKVNFDDDLFLLAIKRGNQLFLRNGDVLVDLELPK